MANLFQAQETAKKVTPKRISKALFDFIRTLEKQFADDNVSQLFLDSKDIFGEPIGFYSEETESITEGRKEAGQPFNLKESGEFLDKLFAKVVGETVIFGTTDEKKEEVLANLLTKDIFSLDDKSLKIQIDKNLRPLMQQFFRKAFDL
jgi:hypothetical protein